MAPWTQAMAPSELLTRCAATTTSMACPAKANRLPANLHIILMICDAQTNRPAKAPARQEPFYMLGQGTTEN